MFLLVAIGLAVILGIVSDSLKQVQFSPERAIKNSESYNSLPTPRCNSVTGPIVVSEVVWLRSFEVWPPAKKEDIVCIVNPFAHSEVEKRAIEASEEWCQEKLLKLASSLNCPKGCEGQIILENCKAKKEDCKHEELYNPIDKFCQVAVECTAYGSATLLCGDTIPSVGTE